MYGLHGILGSGANWRTFAKRLVERRPEWGVVLVDLREHGRSQGAPPPHTIGTAAGDLEDLASVLEFDGKQIHGILGHSFGGKVALHYRQRAGEHHLTTWVIDSSPGADPNAMFASRDDSAVKVLSILEGLPKQFASRDAFIETAMQVGLSQAIAQWLAMNFEGRDGAFVSRLDLKSIRSLLADYYDRDLWDGLDDESLPGDAHVVVAGRSTAISVDDRDTLASLAARNPERVFVHTIAESGHWVHADALDRLVDIVATRLVQP
jgi:pimeloyl-ACP methyl ester carboxylesterase